MEYLLFVSIMFVVKDRRIYKIDMVFIFLLSLVGEKNIN